MAPIRVGFLGLSKSGWARNAHFPYLDESNKYQIVVICNSSVASSQDAIKLYNLPASTKAYSKPEDLANDRDIDLVLEKMSMSNGRSARTLAEAEELLRLKNEGKVKIAEVGLQGRQAPILKKAREVIASGRIGKVLSSNWVGYGTFGGDTMDESIAYFANREIGGNLVSIHFGHAVDYIQYVLGYGFKSPPKTLLANRRPTVKLVDSKGKVINAKYPKTTDDTIWLHGTLSTGIPLSMTLRGGKAFKGTPCLDWRIYGEKGEIRITASGTFIQIGYPDLILEVHDNETDSVERVDPKKDEFESAEGWKEASRQPARNVARLYKGLADGKVNCTFEDAVERHQLIDGMYTENRTQG